MKHSCSRCSFTWTGLRIAHCAGCHRTFSTPANFDIHRSRYRCHDPASITYSSESVREGELRLKLGSRGVWIGNTDRKED